MKKKKTQNHATWTKERWWQFMLENLKDASKSEGPKVGRNNETRKTRMSVKSDFDHGKIKNIKLEGPKLCLWALYWGVDPENIHIKLIKPVIGTKDKRKIKALEKYAAADPEGFSVDVWRLLERVKFELNLPGNPHAKLGRGDAYADIKNRNENLERTSILDEICIDLAQLQVFLRFWGMYQSKNRKKDAEKFLEDLNPEQRKIAIFMGKTKYKKLIHGYGIYNEQEIDWNTISVINFDSMTDEQQERLWLHYHGNITTFDMQRVLTEYYKKELIRIKKDDAVLKEEKRIILERINRKIHLRGIVNFDDRYKKLIKLNGFYKIKRYIEDKRKKNGKIDKTGILYKAPICVVGSELIDKMLVALEQSDTKLARENKISMDSVQSLIEVINKVKT